MKRRIILVIRHLEFAAVMLLLGCAMTGPSTQQEQRADAVSPSQVEYLHRGVVDDWTHHHAVFSNPGTLEDAIRNGRREEWERIVRDPRYRMQWVKRYSAADGLTADDATVLQAPTGVELPVGVFQKKWNKKEGFKEAPLHGDWSVSIAPGGSGEAFDKYPAKYTFAPIDNPSCSNDFIVFTVNRPGGANSQANIIGFNNLYATTCPGVTSTTPPPVLFAYLLGTGTVSTSPVLSEDGTKVAVVENIAGGSKFHVVTLDKRGNTGCPNSAPCNGNLFSSPVAPCTVNSTTSCATNSAVDKNITMSGGVADTNSGPFVDYQNDIAYVGDNTGKLHKFTGVFQTATPTEVVTGGWPVTVAAGVALTPPVFDGGASQHIFVGGNNGKLYCITFAGALCTPTSSITVGNGPIQDAPIVDSTQETVFAAANNTTATTLCGTPASTCATLTQATTALSSQVNVNMGFASTAANGTTDLYNGAFDNAYFALGPASGHMYFCGNATGAATPTLYRVSFNSAGTMNSPRDPGSFLLGITGNAGTGVECTPLTEVFNSGQTKDYLFLLVKNTGFGSGTPNCGSTTCLMSFSLPTASPFTFPTSANSTTNANLTSSGISAIIMDNVSTTTTGASQIYFSNIGAGTGVQVSQSALQ